MITLSCVLFLFYYVQLTHSASTRPATVAIPLCGGPLLPDAHYREQDFSGNTSFWKTVAVSGLGLTFNEVRTNSMGSMWFVKVFSKSILNSEAVDNIQVRWGVTTRSRPVNTEKDADPFPASKAHLMILDGAYDAHNDMQFPTSGGSTWGFPIVQTPSQRLYFSTFELPFIINETYIYKEDVAWENSKSDQVTLIAGIRDGDQQSIFSLTIASVELEPLQKFTYTTGQAVVTPLRSGAMQPNIGHIGRLCQPEPFVVPGVYAAFFRLDDDSPSSLLGAIPPDQSKSVGTLVLEALLATFGCCCVLLANYCAFNYYKRRLKRIAEGTDSAFSARRSGTALGATGRMRQSRTHSSSGSERYVHGGKGKKKSGPNSKRHSRNFRRSLGTALSPADVDRYKDMFDDNDVADVIIAPSAAAAVAAPAGGASPRMMATPLPRQVQLPLPTQAASSPSPVRPFGAPPPRTTNLPPPMTSTLTGAGAGFGASNGAENPNDLF